MRKWLREGWSRLSLQYKMVLLCAVFVVPMLVMIGMLFSEFTFYQRQADRMLSEYAVCVDYSAAFRQEGEQLGQLAYRAPDARAMEEYAVLCSQTDARWQALAGPESYDSEDARLIKQVIARSMRSFRGRQSVFLSALDAGTFDTAVFTELQEQSDDLRSYIDDLTDVLLTEGRSSYLELGQQIASQNITLVWVFALCTIGLAVGLTMLARSVVLPVRRLSHAAQLVAAGQYDTPDPQYGQKDELGQLTASFVQMKHQIAKTIHALEAETQLEKDLRRHEAEEARLNQLVEQSRFAQLQSQINPHFLFNTLQSIANMSELEQATVTEDMILRLSKFFRYTLETDEVIVSLQRELDLLRDYISLQELRFSDRVSFEMECDPACGSFSVPKFILQPLVENAIVHGMRSRISGGRIRVKTRRTQQGCIVMITDNGCGFSADSLQQREDRGRRSIGLVNIARRMELTGGVFRLYSRPGWGTAAKLLLMVQKEDI